MALVRIETQSGHRYELDGERCPGVTTLIGDGVPKPALRLWASGLVASYVQNMPFGELQMLRQGDEGILKKLKLLPNTVAKQAAVKGTDIHRYAERLIGGYDVQVPLPLAGYVKACCDFMADWRVSPVHVEAVVGSRKHHYSGTVDLIADLPDGRRAIMDYKTGRTGIWPEAALQLAAYRHAEFLLADGGERLMSSLGITCAYAVWIRDGSYEVRPLRTDLEVFDVFLAAATTANATKVMRHWVGAPETWKVPA